MENIVEKEKINRERAMMRKLCDHLVPRLMNENGIEYILTHNSKSTVISVHIKDNKWIDFRFHSFDATTFIARLEKIPAQIRAIRDLFETLDGDITIVKRPA